MISGHRDIEHAVRSLNLKADVVFDPEYLRAMRTCDATCVLAGPVTFHSEPGTSRERWDEQWCAWLAGPFAQIIAPAIHTAMGYAQSGQYRELAAVDQAYADTIGDRAEASSRTTGSRMLKRLSAARGVRWLDRFQAAVEAGTTPGHLAVVYACQGALFHLGPRLVIATYAYWEWAAAAATGRRQPDAVSSFQVNSAPGIAPYHR